MRILVIRGENLASLYGKFELPLDTGPIADAGLFSISGPTGSGKSTLMDALCLALFGKTPRLGERGKGVMVGREGDDPALRVEANDERDLVSRGTAGGFAEVDFEGIDGKRYRARWSAHRARGQAGGKFQPVRVKVTDAVTGDAVAGTVRERDEVVPRLLGYSFEEFRRAVVLPQFEFTAFLKATSAVRADILERVTGTDVYTHISIAAFQRSSTEMARLEELERRAAEIQLLSDGDRAELEGRARALASDEAAARERGRVATEAVRWHETDERNREEARAAAGSLELARSAASAAEPLRAELARVEQAETLRPLHDEAGRTEGELERTRERLAQAGEGAQRAEVASRTAHADASEAQGALATAAERLEAIRPEIARAHLLDVALQDVQARHDAASAACRTLDAASKDARMRLDEAGRAVVDLEARREGAAAWLTAHAQHAPLAGEWPRWEALLRNHAAHVQDASRKQDVARVAEARLATSLSGKATAAERVSGLDAAFTALEETARIAEAAAAGDDLSALQRVHAAADSRRGALQELARLAEEAGRAHREGEAAATDVAEAETLGGAAGRELAALERKVVAAEAALQADRASLRRTQDALSLDEHRDRLEDGAPCPLCGATEHPYARKAPTETLEKTQLGVVSAREKDLQALRKEETELQKRATRADERGSKGRALREKHEVAFSKVSGEFAALRERAAIVEVPPHPVGSAGKLAELLLAAGTALTHARSAMDLGVARRQAAESSRKEVEERRVEVEKARKELGAAEREADAAAAEAEKTAEALRTLHALRDGVEAELEPALAFLGDWRTRARDDGPALARACKALASDHADHVLSAAAAESALGPARTALEAARATLAGKEAAASDAQGRVDELARELAGKQAERLAALGGRPAAEVEADHVAAEQGARKRLDDSRARAEKARIDQARAAQELEGAASRLAEAEAEAVASRERLSAGLAGLGTEPGGLAALLARGREWIVATRRSLQAIATAVTEASSTHGERLRRVEAHAEKGSLAGSKDAALLEAAAATDAEAAAKGLVAEVQFRLRADLEGRARAANLSVERDAQHAVAARWRALSDVIGSSDGKKLRSFAQGLTLDALLRQANHHLLELAPRYQLMRVPGQDLELQIVDRDLGDEVRSVNGLSGGESFLVSLALALSLASVATRVSHSRNLFIDEGFGTLDRDTLEHAMAALDSLRASGRTVGVISHVPELHERIGVRVDVERTGVGRSRIVVPGAGTPP